MNLIDRFIKRLIKRFDCLDVILCYHSLFSKTQTLDNISIKLLETGLDEGSFEKQILWLSNFASFVSLDEIVEEKSTKYPACRVSITFDDGLKNNLTLGLPIFERYRIPVTIFVATDFVKDSSKIPWWHLVTYILSLWNDSFEIFFNNKIFVFDLKSNRGKNRFRAWSKEIFMSCQADKQALLYDRMFEVLYKRFPITKNCFATPKDIRIASQSPWLSFGGHTCSHLNLACYKNEHYQDEIVNNKKLIERWTGQPVHWFAYPYGKSIHRNSTAIEALRRAGFSGAVTTDSALINNYKNNFELPRVPVASKRDIIYFKFYFLWTILRKIYS